MKDAKRLEKRKQEENHEMIKTENKQIYQRKTKNIFLKKILFLNKKKEREGGSEDATYQKNKYMCKVVHVVLKMFYVHSIIVKEQSWNDLVLL